MPSLLAAASNLASLLPAVQDLTLLPVLLLLLLLAQALSKYAFGMGSLQVILSTLLFTAVALPVGSGLGTWFLEVVCHAPPSLVSIRTVDEVRACDNAEVHGSGGLVLWHRRAHCSGGSLEFPAWSSGPWTR